MALNTPYGLNWADYFDNGTVKSDVTGYVKNPQGYTDNGNFIEAKDLYGNQLYDEYIDMGNNYRLTPNGIQKQVEYGGMDNGPTYNWEPANPSQFQQYNGKYYEDQGDVFAEKLKSEPWYFNSQGLLSFGENPSDIYNTDYADQKYNGYASGIGRSTYGTQDMYDWVQQNSGFRNPYGHIDAQFADNGDIIGYNIAENKSDLWKDRNENNWWDNTKDALSDAVKFIPEAAGYALPMFSAPIGLVNDAVGGSKNSIVGQFGEAGKDSLPYYGAAAALAMGKPQFALGMAQGLLGGSAPQSASPTPAITQPRPSYSFSPYDWKDIADPQSFSEIMAGLQSEPAQNTWQDANDEKDFLNWQLLA